MKVLVLSIGVSCLGGIRIEGKGEGKAGYPQFEGDYIKISAPAAPFVRCGGFTIASKSDETVRVSSWKYVRGAADPKDKSSSFKKLKQLSDGWVLVEGGTLTNKYNWPGLFRQYRIFCQRLDKHGTWMDAPCKQVVDLQSIRHRVSCGKRLLQWAGYGAGAGATHKYLKLK